MNALRRATGDGTYGRVPAHITLVPPVNVREDRWAAALAVLRAAAAATRPFTLDLGPPTTFLPANPVLFLPVLGDGVPWLESLRSRVFTEPLARPLSWPFVPHVTLADEADPERIAAAQVALSSFGARMPVDRVCLLQEGAGRVWGPVADCELSAPAVIGRGGLPVELTVGGILDREASALVRACEPAGTPPSAGEALVIAARREGRVVGVAAGAAYVGVSCLTSLVVGPAERGQGVGSHLLAAFGSEAAGRGHARLSATVAAGSQGEGFLRRRGWTVEAHLCDWYGGQDHLVLRRG